MTISFVQAHGTSSSGTPSVVLSSPTAGRTLVMGVAVYNSSGGQGIATPSGWTAATGVFRNQQSGWDSVMANWSGQVFYKTASGSEGTITSPGTNTTASALVVAELSAAGSVLGTAVGWNPHPGAGVAEMPTGNLAADGWSALDVGSNADALFLGWWWHTGAPGFGGGAAVVPPTVDQAGGTVAAYSSSNVSVHGAMTGLPVTSTSGGYRLTGVLSGNDNFPAWAIVAFGSATTTTPGTAPTVYTDWDGDGFSAGIDDIGTYVMSWRITRGASAEITGGAQPGQATVILKNTDNRFNPANTGGTLYGKLRDGVPLWIGVSSTGRLTSSGSADYGLFGGRLVDISPIPVPGATVPPTVEMTAEDALGWLSRVPVRLGYEQGRAHDEFRAAVLAAAGETSTDLDDEIDTMPLSAGDGHALDILEQLNQATGTRHFVKPGATPSAWYTYTSRNRMHNLAGSSQASLGTAQKVTSTNGWRLSADTVINQQKATVTPITFTPAQFTVWEAETLPVQVTSSRPYEVWVDFDDYVAAPTVNSSYSGGTPVISLTSFGDSAKLSITASAGTVTFSSLRIEGSLARRWPQQSHIEDDTTSQAFPRGVRAGSEISGEYVGTLASARGIAEHVVWRYASPQFRPTLTVENWFPTMFSLDLFDVISFTSPQLGVTARLFEIVGLTHEGLRASQDVVHHTVTYVLQECRVQSATTWFVADTSTANGSAILGY